jgi:tripartite-type tricarboxylate transporter receptor subunit TctC
MKRKLFALLILPLMLWVSPAATVLAQSYPSYPIRIILPGAAGSVLDVFARRLTDSLSRSLGQPVIVDNRPGANGFIEQKRWRGEAGWLSALYAAGTSCINPPCSRLPFILFETLLRSLW